VGRVLREARVRHVHGGGRAREIDGAREEESDERSRLQRSSHIQKKRSPSWTPQ
jgi:hypothetical protein